MARIPDADVGESLKLLCKNDDIKECLYNAVQKYKKMKSGWWRQSVTTVVFFLIAWIILEVVKYFIILLLNSIT